MEYVKYYLADPLDAGIEWSKVFRAVGILYRLTVACRRYQNLMM